MKGKVVSRKFVSIFLFVVLWPIDFYIFCLDFRKESHWGKLTITLAIDTVKKLAAIGTKDIRKRPYQNRVMLLEALALSSSGEVCDNRYDEERSTHSINIYSSIDIVAMGADEDVNNQSPLSYCNDLSFDFFAGVPKW